VGCGPPPPDISIHVAASEGNIEAVKQHLAAGTDVDEEGGDILGRTALHWAAREGHKEIAELLLAEGADVNARNDFKGTPLHDAADYGQKEIAELLIAKGANVNARRGGLTPLDVAEEVDEDDSPEDKAVKKEIADLLRKHGGKTSLTAELLRKHRAKTNKELNDVGN